MQSVLRLRRWTASLSCIDREPLDESTKGRSARTVSKPWTEIVWHADGLGSNETTLIGGACHSKGGASIQGIHPVDDLPPVQNVSCDNEGMLVHVPKVFANVPSTSLPLDELWSLWQVPSLLTCWLASKSFRE